MDYWFQGRSSVSLDAKGRLAIPARYRDALLQQCEGCMTLTHSTDACLLLLPRPVWESRNQEMTNGDKWPKSIQRIFIGSALDVEMDASGRVLIPQKGYQDHVGLARDVLLLGMGSHFEIWDADKLAENEATTLAAGMPDALKNFSF